MNAALLFAVLAATLSHSPDLYVSGFFAANVQRYHGPLDAAAGAHPAPGQADATYATNVVRRPWGLAFGPDGNLYVANESGSTPAIAKVDGPFTATAGTVHPFVNDGAFFDVAFGRDGNLYAAGHGAVQRFDIVTGQLVDQFTKGHDLIEVHGIAFGPDGLLYVSNYDSCVMGPNGCTGSAGEVVRFDGITGEFVDVLLHVANPWKIAFAHNGDLLVVAWSGENNRVLRVRPHPVRWLFPNAAPSASVFIERENWFPLYLAVGPDGDVYVSNSDSAGSNGSVLRFDGKTGAFIDTFVADVPGSPRGLAFAIGAQ